MGIGHYRQLIDRETVRFDSATQRFICLEIAYHLDGKGVLRMTQNELAEMMLLSRPTIARELAKLAKKRILKHVRPGRYALAIAADKAEDDEDDMEPPEARDRVSVDMEDSTAIAIAEADVRAGILVRVPGIASDGAKLFAQYDHV